MDGQPGPLHSSAFGYPAAASSSSSGSSSAADSSSEGVFRHPAPRGRGSAPRGWRGGVTMRGSGRPPFGNRSAVFNNPDAPPSTSSTTTQLEPQLQSSSQNHNDASAFSSLADQYPSMGGEQNEQIGYDETEEDHPYSYDEAFATPMLSKPQSAALHVNALGGTKESDDERKRRFENLPKQNRFFELRTQREALRSAYIREGVLPDPDRPTDLAEAKALKGSCMEMCPEFEREEREFQNEGDALEMFPGTQRIDPRLAVKIYRRPAAGRELPLPEDVRPPEVLCTTLDYLLHELLPPDPSSATFTAVQPFMWNRTRAIRQDFIVQGDGDALAIECHERIARYHILCLHWRGGVGAEGWSEQQELEQLRKTIRSLTEFYEDMRRKQGIVSPNEAEFRSYNLLLHMQDPETLREVEALPDTVFQSEAVQTALKLRAYAQRSNNLVRRGRPRNTEATMNLWTRFFSLLRQSKNVTYLLACLAENTFSQVRAGALKAMGKTYLPQHAPLPLDYLERSLGLDSQTQALEFALALGAEEAFAPSGELLGVRLGKVNDEKPLPAVPFSKTIVEAKRGTMTCQAVVDGVASHAAPMANNRRRTMVVPTTLPTPRAAAVLPTKPSAPPMILPTTPQPSLPQAFAAKGKSAVVTSFTEPPAATGPPAFAPPPSSAFSFAKTSSGFHQPVPQPPDEQAPPVLPAETSARGTEANKSAFQSKPFGHHSVVFNEPNAVAPPVADVAQPKAVRKRTAPVQFDSTIAPALPEHKPALEARKDSETRIAPPPSTTKLERSPFGKPDASPPPASTAAPQEDVPPPVVIKESEVERHRRFASRLEAVTQELLRHVLQDALQHKVRSIGEQACLREARLRHSKAREQFVSFYTRQVADKLLGDVLDEAVLSSASDALADKNAERQAKADSFKRWRAALSRLRERAQQTSRLHKLRAHLEVRKPSVLSRPYDEHTTSGERDRAMRGQTDRDLLVAISTSSKRRRQTDTLENLYSTSTPSSFDAQPPSNGKRRVVVDLTEDDDDGEDWGEVANTVEQVHHRAIAKSRRIGSGLASKSTPTPRDALLRTSVPLLPQHEQAQKSPVLSSPSLAALRNVIDSAKHMLSVTSGQ